MIGINAQIKSQSGGGEGVGFAVPVDAVRRSLRELREKGRVDYGYLGVETLTVWPQLAEPDRAPPEYRCARAGRRGRQPGGGLRAWRRATRTSSFQGQDGITVGGDLIVAVDGKQLTREHDLADEISARRAGENVELTHPCATASGERWTSSSAAARRARGPRHRIGLPGRCWVRP